MAIFMNLFVLFAFWKAFSSGTETNAKSVPQWTPVQHVKYPKLLFNSHTEGSLQIMLILSVNSSNLKTTSSCFCFKKNVTTGDIWYKRALIQSNFGFGFSKNMCTHAHTLLLVGAVSVRAMPSNYSGN